MARDVSKPEVETFHIGMVEERLGKLKETVTVSAC